MIIRFKLTVIVVNWNRCDDVIRCVCHLTKVLGPGSEIIVVDNGSTDGSAERLAALPAIRLIVLGANVGPSEARNVGIRAAGGEHLLFLDSDALLSRHGLERLVTRMDARPDVGVIGCRIVNAATRRLDQWIYAQRAETHEYAEFETYSFSAAGALVRAEALRRVGPFWGELFT
jgi:N-acetylglucosaminyl-diphospho-decaprenol L-rhamnosyltransferase